MADDGHPERVNAAQPDDVVVDLCTNLLTEGACSTPLGADPERGRDPRSLA